MSPQTMGRFWTMLAHYHGQLWNGNEIAASMGISATTARHYLDALEQILRAHPGTDAYFYAIHSGSELDLFFPNLRLGIEVKYQDAPRLTRSMRIAMNDLKLTELLVVYPGDREYALADGIRAVPLAAACRIR
jgi:predicted AAA+ superfamily ATPase